MTADNPLPLLASLTETGNDSVSLSTRKLCARGNPKGPVATFEIALDANGAPIADAVTARAIVKEIKKRRIHHHAQPQIETIINGLLAASEMVQLDNEIVCTREMILGTGACDYDPDLFDLAGREGISESMISEAETDSSILCEIYSAVFTSYIRNLREDIFGEPGPAPRNWTQTLTDAERQIVEQGPSQDQLPEGWSLEEAQSLWLMHCAGEDLTSLAAMVGQPEEALSKICALFPQAAKAA